MASLQEQLLKAGMIDPKKARQLEKEKRKQAKQNKGQPQTDESKELAKQAIAEKAERARQLNLEKQIADQGRAVAAQIKQLIELNCIDRKDGDTSYQFTHGKKIKKIYVTKPQFDQLVKGTIAIALLKDNYELVPASVARKIKEREESVILVHNLGTEDQTDDDEYYAAFKIPEDLDW